MTVKEFYNPYTSHCYWEGVEENDEVIAWCKISDIEPYKPDYPKTYEECCEVLYPNAIKSGKVLTSGYNCEKLKKLGELLICRDAYWKIANWEPTNGLSESNAILDFPTKELRDAFYENFKELIETCKELL